MVIEPLASVMTVQAQTAKPVVSEAKAVEPDSTKVVQNVVKIDETTNVVEQTRNKEHSNSNENGENQTREQNNEQIKKAVEQLNKNMPHSEAVFGIHENTNRVMIKLVDKETKEVIKEFPPEKTLDMLSKVLELAGMLVDEKR